MRLAFSDSPSTTSPASNFSSRRATLTRHVLDAVDVAEARELRQTTRERGLAALEAGALAAAGTGLLTVHTTAGSLTITGARATANALARVGRTRCRLEILQFHVVSPFRETTEDASSGAGSSPPANLPCMRTPSVLGASFSIIYRCRNKANFGPGISPINLTTQRKEPSHAKRAMATSCWRTAARWEASRAQRCVRIQQGALSFEAPSLSGRPPLLLASMSQRTKKEGAAWLPLAQARRAVRSPRP